MCWRWLGVKLLGQKGEYMAMLRCLFSVALYHQSTLSSRFYSQQGGRTLKRRDLEVQHSHLFIFKCFVQLQSLQYQLSNRSSSVWWVMLPSLHDLRLGVSYPRRVVDDVDAARSAFLSVARQCRAAAPAECASKIHGAYVSAWMGLNPCPIPACIFVASPRSLHHELPDCSLIIQIYGSTANFEHISQ